MNSPEENNTEKPAEIYVQRDVLGQDKTSAPSSPTKAKPARIFLVLGILVIVAVVYWLTKH